MPATHKYVHPSGKGFGEHHATEAGRELPAEMRDLDLAHGAEVVHDGTDEDGSWVTVAWTDRSGNARRTTIDPDFFASHFEALTAPEGM